MMRVIGYRDLRPVDWASGKRLPLEAGEGHLCDRCGAEHAVIYDVQDTESGKIYQVGSTCAKKQFGFDVDKEARDLVRASKKQDAIDLDSARQQVVRESADEVATAIAKMPVPELTSSPTTYGTRWTCGDSSAIAAFGRPDEEAQKMALRGWVSNRARDCVPRWWSSIWLAQKSNLRHVESMLSKLQGLVLSRF